jgi:hypothetical protein
LTDTKAQKQLITNWILTVSKQIETFLSRYLAIASYTEYFNTPSEKEVTFHVKGYPVTTLTSVYVDGDGLWDGGESEVTDCFIGKDSNCIVAPTQIGVYGYKTIRVIYTGGLAYNGVKSVFTISGSTGTWTAGSFVYGGTSEAVGIIKASTTTTLTVEILYGIFAASETLTEYSDEDLTTVGDASATLSAISQQSLVEQYPDIVRAAEIQVRHYWKHKDDFELSSTSKDATNQKRDTFSSKNILLPEVMALLSPYRNIVV